MKNIALKSNFYKNIGFFTHIYFVNADYVFNEKSFDEIIEFIYENPFHDVLIHANDINADVVRLIKEISKTKHVWLESQSFLAEDFVMLKEDAMKVLGIDKRVGLLEPGYVANLVAYDDNWQVQRVMMGGTWIYERNN